MRQFQIHDLYRSYKDHKNASYSYDGNCSRIDINHPSVEGSISGFQIDKGVILAINDLELKKPFAFPSLTSQEYFRISFILESDHTIANNSNLTRHRIYRGTCIGLLFRKPGINRIYPNKSRLYSIDLGIKISLLRKIITQFPEASPIRNKLSEIIRSKTTTSFSGTIPPSIYSLLSEISKEHDNKLAGRLIMTARIWEILGELVKNHENLLWEEQRNSFLTEEDLVKLKNAKEYLENNISESLTLKEISRKFCLNEFKLKKGFKECFNTTIHNYLIDLRLCASCELLKNRSCPVSEIAFEVGYQCPSKYINSFRKKFGVTPGQFRKVKVECEA